MTAALTARDQHSRVTVEEVARKFKCGLETAKKTLKVTTQAGVRQALHPLHRRYQVDHLNLNRRRLNSTFHMDALQSKVKSLNGNLYANLFTNGKYMRVYPTAGKSSREFADSLTDFTDAVGIPDTVFCDCGTRICWAAHTVYEGSSTAENPDEECRERMNGEAKTIRVKLRFES